MQNSTIAPISGDTKEIALLIPRDHALIGAAAQIPVNDATPVISVSPVVLSVPGRIVDLQVRVSAPITGRDLPVILLSHGHGRSNHLSSLNGNAPLADFWAAHGFVVIQPTHLDSKTLSFGSEQPGWPLFWQSRVEDMKHILDGLDRIEAAVPPILGRLDRDRVAVAGLSMGGQTASMLLGARLTDPETGAVIDLADPRIKAGVLLSPPGSGGADLSAYAAETTDESPERVAAVQRLTWAYLRSELYPGDPAWSTACAALEGLPTLGRIECK